MIPTTGWLAPLANTNGAVLDKDLPVFYVGTYTDSTAGGKPISGIARKLGRLDASLDVVARQFTVSITRKGTHGALLIDRIE